MIEFKKIELADKEWVENFLQQSDYMGCEYSFNNNFVWSEQSKIEIANVCGRYLLKIGAYDQPLFLFPTGDGDLKACVQEMISYCADQNHGLKIISVLDDDVAKLEELFPDKFKFISDRGSYDYIYLTEDLINLTGKKYSGKRNHINRFLENDWSFEDITKDNIGDCLAMIEKWDAINNSADDASKMKESQAVRRTIKYFFELEMDGGILRVDGEIVAFSIGKRLNSETYGVHIEKAYADVQGAYPMINQQFLKRFATEYKYVNREDDVNSEGLRKAKLSYKPTFLLEKSMAVSLKPDTNCGQNLN